jgi:hypothetical protein
MTQPTTREQFKYFCLRSLGAPVIDINVDDDQIDDRIDEAIQWWIDYAWDGNFKTYLTYIVTQTDVDNKYITLPSNIIGAVEIFDMGDALQTNNIFNIRYQIALNDLYTLTSVSMVPYYMAMSHIQFLEQMLVGRQPVRYNRYNGNRFYIDQDWLGRCPAGTMIVINCYAQIDPDNNPGVWSDIWFQRYATALIKRQWGNHLKKFKGMKLQGGIEFNGQQIYDEAVAEIQDIHQKMLDSSLPSDVFIG